MPEEVLAHIDFVHPSVRFPLRHHTRHMEPMPDLLYNPYDMADTLDSVLNADEEGEAPVRQAIAWYQQVA